MTKDVLIKISGMQAMEEDSDTIEMITAGDYYQKNGKHYVVFDEVMEGFEGSIHNIMKLSADLLDIRKTGIIGTHMIFTPGQTEKTHYATPMGEMYIETTTNKIFLEEQEDTLKMKVEYSLDINYEHVSDCTITVDITSRGKAQLNLNS